MLRPLPTTPTLAALRRKSSTRTPATTRKRARRLAK